MTGWERDGGVRRGRTERCLLRRLQQPGCVPSPSEHAAATCLLRRQLFWSARQQCSGLFTHMHNIEPLALTCMCCEVFETVSVILGASAHMFDVCCTVIGTSPQETAQMWLTVVRVGGCVMFPISVPASPPASLPANIGPLACGMSPPKVHSIFMGQAPLMAKTSIARYHGSAGRVDNETTQPQHWPNRHFHSHCCQHSSWL